MNSDDLEKRLERLAWRRTPAPWRQEILDAACAQKPGLGEETPPAAGWFARLRLPIPWIAFAGLWALLLLCNGILLGPGRAPSTSQSGLAKASDQPTVWNLQVAELRQGDLGEKKPSSQSQYPDAAKPWVRPRSDRRQLHRFGRVEDEVGEMSVA